MLGLFVAVGLCAMRPNIVPEPLIMDFSDAYFVLSEKTVISYDKSIENLEKLAKYIQQWIFGATGWTITISEQIQTTGIILSKTANATATKESYDLTVTTDAAKIEAQHYSGFLYGFTTLLQLFPPEIYSLNPEVECKMVESVECRKYEWTQATVEWKAQCVTIKDEPRYGYRGIMVDTSRHFFEIDVLKRLMRVMALHKLNTLQIHLTDDPGCRFESKKYPQFVTIGSVRAESPLPWAASQGDGKQYGPFYYTQDELRDLVRYGNDLGITIVPEFEMPGHALGALAGYSEYSCRGEPLSVSTRWGGSIDVYCPGNDETIKHLENVLDEICDIFPSEYIHIGADEVQKGRWQACSKCQARIKSEGLSGVDELQGWMVSHFASYLESKGRRLVGWGEILQGGKTAKSAIVMTWQGIMAMVEAANAGHNVIDDSNRHFYFNYKQFPHDNDIYEYNSPNDFVPYWYVYTKNSDFMIPKEQRGLVLGVQACAWSEYIWGGEDDLHYKLFPRTTALSEIAWTKTSNKNWYRHITGQVRVHRKRLEFMGVKSAPLMLRQSPKWTSADLTTEWQTHTWNLTTAINRGECAYQAAFIKTAGANDLNVRNVRILVGGQEWGYDLHEGTASFRPNYSAFFEWEFASAVSGDTSVELVAEIRGVGGVDCEGDLVVFATTSKSPYPTP